MELERQLQNEFMQLTNQYDELQVNGQRMVPKVVQHFNEYLQTVVNPALPKGYAVLESNHALFTNGKFIVNTGPYQTPVGITNEPLEIENIVMDLLSKYQKNTPWIDSVWHTFSLSQ